MGKKFKLKINLNEERVYQPKESVEGHISVSVQQDIEVDILSYKLFLEIRGLTRTNVIMLGQEKMTSQEQLSGGTVKNYPFALKNHQHETYKGQNVELLIRMEATLKLKDKPSTNFLLSKVGYIHSGSKESISKYLFFEYEKGNYKIVEDKINFPQSLVSCLIGLAILAFTGIGLFFLGFLSDPLNRNIVLVGGLIFFLLGAFYLWVEIFLIGQIKAKLIDLGEGQFQLELENKKKWESSKSVAVRYKIFEEVIDRRGTSSSTETNYIYLSETKTIENPWRGATLVFDYPKKSIPMFRFEDVRIYWLLEVKVFSSFWLKFTYSHEVLVSHR
ncbi:MAG: hypothetical protein AB8G15_12465 [Saprospiraceae bacterium]